MISSLHREVSRSGVLYTGGCHNQVSSTQGVVMIRCPLHRGRGVSCSDVLYTKGCMLRCPLHRGLSCSGVL